MNEFLDSLMLVLFFFAGIGLAFILIESFIKMLDKPLKGKITEFLTNLFK